MLDGFLLFYSLIITGGSVLGLAMMSAYHLISATIYHRDLAKIPARLLWVLLLPLAYIPLIGIYFLDAYKAFKPYGLDNATVFCCSLFLFSSLLALVLRRFKTQLMVHTKIYTRLIIPFYMSAIGIVAVCVQSLAIMLYIEYFVVPTLVP